MSKHAHMTPDLTKNQSLVMSALSKAEGPLSAYSILDELRDQGFRAPLQVYRALEKLMDVGLVHRLESLLVLYSMTGPLVHLELGIPRLDCSHHQANKSRESFIASHRSMSPIRLTVGDCILSVLAQKKAHRSESGLVQ